MVSSGHACPHVEMPRLLVVSLLLALLFRAAPAAALTGRVVNGAGAPVSGAEVSILGRPGTAVTDADGRFTWTPDPPVPFEVLVVAPGGMFMKPILVERLEAGQVLVLTVESLVSERVIVSGLYWNTMMFGTGMSIGAPK